MESPGREALARREGQLLAESLGAICVRNGPLLRDGRLGAPPPPPAPGQQGLAATRHPQALDRSRTAHGPRDGRPPPWSWYQAEGDPRDGDPPSVPSPAELSWGGSNKGWWGTGYQATFVRWHVLTPVSEVHRSEAPNRSGLVLTRLWATERKHVPVQDVAAAGGWNSVETVRQLYQQADPAGVLRAVTGSA